MITFSFWHRETGAVHPVKIFTSDDDKREEFVALNTPPDHVSIAQDLDPKRHRVNPNTHQVEDISQ